MNKPRSFCFVYFDILAVVDGLTHILPGVETELQFQYGGAANFMTSTACPELSTYLIIVAKRYFTMFNTSWFTLTSDTRL